MKNVIFKDGKLIVNVGVYEQLRQAGAFDLPERVCVKTIEIDIGKLSVYCGGKSILRYIQNDDKDSVCEVIDEYIDEHEISLLRNLEYPDSITMIYSLKRIDEDDVIEISSVDKAIDIIKSLRDISLADFIKIKSEFTMLSDIIERKECKRIFDEKVNSSNNRVLETFLESYYIESVEFHSISNGEEFVKAIVFCSNNDSVAFIYEHSIWKESVDVDYDNVIYIDSANKDSLNDLLPNIDFDELEENEINEFLEFIKTFKDEAIKSGIEL